jgi:hypothetical protein
VYKETNMTQISAGISSLTVCAVLAGLMLPSAGAEAPKAEPPGVQADQHVAMAEKTFANFVSDPGQDYFAMTQTAGDSLLSSSFRGGVDAAIAAGPVGTGVQSSFQGDFITVVRSQGFYGGLNFDGSMIKANDAWNQGYYGKPVTVQDILFRGDVSNAKAEGLLNAVGDAAAHGEDYGKTPGPKAETNPAPKAENAPAPKAEATPTTKAEKN